MVTRRIFEYGVGVILCLIMVLGVAINSFAQKEIVICLWGGEFTNTQRKAYLDSFEKKTGVKVRTVSFPEFSKIKAQVVSGNIEWDVVDIEKKWLIRGEKEGMFEPLDYSVIDTKDFFPEAVYPHGLNYIFYAFALGYNKNKYSEPNRPKNWRDFWDVQKYPGSRSLYNNPAGMLEIALLADGVPPNKLYPLDVDRAFKSLEKIKPFVSVWYRSVAQTTQMVATQEVDLIACPAARLYFAIKDGAPVGIEMNQAVADRGCLVVLKGTKRKETAMQLINYATRAENQAAWANLYPQGMANKKAYPLINQEVLPYIPTSPQNIETIAMQSPEWWAENEAAVFERWNRFLMK